MVEVKRIESAIFRLGDSFLHRVFREGEIDYCRSRARPGLHYAARFAAKEAVSKAFGVGIGAGLGWLDIEISRDERGKPSLVWHEKGLGLTKRFGVRAAFLSLTHTDEYASAYVILSA